MIDLSAAAAAFAELHALIAREPGLAELAEAAAELREQSQRLARGDWAIGTLSCRTRVGSIPTLELAEEIQEVVSHVPSIDGDEPPELKRAVVRLHGNLVDAVQFAVFAQYPDVVPRYPRH